MDKIVIENLKIKATHGLFNFEKKITQPFIFSLSLSGNFEKAAKSDNIEDTVDYCKIKELVIKITKENCFNLIEKLALVTIEELFKNFKNLFFIKIKITKPKALNYNKALVSVELERRRTQFFPSTVYLSLGSNLGDRKKNLFSAISMLEAIKGISNIEVSKIYETTPVAMESKNEFLNLAVKLQTTLLPYELLEETKKIEEKLKRERYKLNNDRTIDIDILFYEELYFNEAKLQLPHRQIFNRAFVLKPLLDLHCPFVCEENLKKVSDQKIKLFLKSK